MKTLHFPHDQSLGTLSRLLGVRDNAPWFPWLVGHNWGDLGEARGDVIVSPEDKLCLECSWQVSKDLSSLMALNADDLAQLVIYNPISLDDEGLAFVRHLTCLRFLSLAGRNISDSGLADLLRALSKLEVLELYWVHIDGTAFTQVDLPMLRALSLQRTWLNDAGMAALSRFLNLRFLDLYSGGATSAVGWRQVSQLPHLQGLYIHGMGITADDLEQLQGMSALRMLSLDVEDDTTLGGLRGPATLLHLNLSGHDVNGSGLTCLRWFPHLTSLWLTYARLTDVTMVHLRHASSLEYLDLAHTPITGIELRHLENLQHLRRLEVTETRIDDGGLAYLPPLVDLEYLSLGNTAITSQGLVPLKQLPKLQHLDLSNTAVDNAAMPILGNLHTLQELHLNGTICHDSGLLQLEGLTNLKRLLVPNEITPALLAALRRILPQCSIGRAFANGYVLPENNVIGGKE